MHSYFRSLSHLGERFFLFPPWRVAPRMHLILFVGWTVMTHLTMCRKTKSRKLPLGCYSIDKTLLDLFPVASRVLGPISRYCVADILLHMKLVPLASRPGLIVGFLRILCHGLCTAQRFHTEEHDHTCRVGCPHEFDSLTHYNECPRLYNIFLSFWRHATILPPRDHFYTT